MKPFLIILSFAVNFSLILSGSPPFDPNSLPCGSFLPFDPVNGRTDPESYGFAGGVAYDGSIQYVSKGNPFCGNPLQHPCTGFVLTGPSNAGGYYSCTNGIQTDDETSSYLVDHPNLLYVPVDTSEIASLPNKLEASSADYTFYFARTMYNGNYRIGKALSNGFWFTKEDNTEMLKTSGFEILICTPPAR